MPTALLTQVLELPAPTRPAKGRYSLGLVSRANSACKLVSFFCALWHSHGHACLQAGLQSLVCVQTHMQVYVCIRAYIHAPACMHTHMQTHACTRTYAHTCTLFLSLISWHPTHPHTRSPFWVQRTVSFLLSYTHSFNTRKIHFPSHPLGSVLTTWRLRRGGRSYFLNWDWNQQCPNIVFHSLRLSLSLFAYSSLCLCVCWSCVCMH